MDWSKQKYRKRRGQNLETKTLAATRKKTREKRITTEATKKDLHKKEGINGKENELVQEFEMAKLQIITKHLLTTEMKEPNSITRSRMK